MRTNARWVLIGPDTHAIGLMARLMPSHYQRLVGWGTKWAMR